MHLNYHLAYHQTSSIYVRFNVFVVIFIMDQWAMCMYFSSPYSHQNMNLFISSAFACITVPFQHNNKIYSVKKITWVTNYKNETSQLSIIMIIPITIIYRLRGKYGLKHVTQIIDSLIIWKIKWMKKLRNISYNPKIL